MNTSNEEVMTGLQLSLGRSRTAGIGEDTVKWTQVWLGGIALGLFTLLIAISAQSWLVVTGPFMLLGISRLMGLRSLWD